MMFTPECLPMGAHPWFIGFWMALSYLWILVHVIFGIIAWVLERRIRNAEGDIRAIENDDSIARWGRMSSIPGYASMANPGSLWFKDIMAYTPQCLPMGAHPWFI